ncbi:MAG: PQQ-binding-like beta-propeller repeat protein [Planctomycetia bacterium]|nr:PQQ-binding-like beta-propeller repeat protein [Planctomycetia bacterium]
MPSPPVLVRVVIATFVVVAVSSLLPAVDEPRYDPVTEAARALAKMDVRLGDCPQFGVSHFRNNVSATQNIPTRWDVTTGFNIKWSAMLGSQTYGTPVVANGKIFIGTNNGNGYVARFPVNVDLGVLACFDEETGKFRWQHSSPILPGGREVNWDLIGACSTPYIEGDRLWYVNNRDEVICLDTEGFLDGENDGPVIDEPNQNKDEADVIWKFDLIGKFGVVPRHASCCSVTALGDTLLVCTSNGTNARRAVANPQAPSFLAMDKNTGKVLWTDRSPGENILNGQWSSPACGVLGGVEQAIFAGGDGWLYSFDARGDNGRPLLLWKFDCNPKTSQFRLERSGRNPILATPVIYDGLVYAGVGEDPEHGEGPGHLWCIDPTKRGDVSPTLVYNKRDPTTPVPPRRLFAADPKAGDFERENNNSASVWHYTGEKPRVFETTMHRTLSSAAIKDGLLFIADESGLFHCLDAKTGAGYWTYDLLAAAWSTPLIVGDCVYIADQDGDVVVFKVAKKMEMVSEQNMGTPVYSTPIVANDVLYIATFNRLFAIAKPK